MYNKFKVKKKIISIALALVLAVQPFASFPMNAFAGNSFAGKRKNFDIDNIIELGNGEIFDVGVHVKNIKPQGATASYSVESQTVFGEGNAVLDEDGKVINPGILKVKVEVGGVSKETYVIADIGGILKTAENASDAASKAAVASYPDPIDALLNRFRLIANHKAASIKLGASSLYFMAAACVGVDKDSEVVAEAAKAAEEFAKNFRAPEDAKAAWNAAKNACESAKTAWNKGSNLEAELQVVCMAYWIAEAIWTQIGNNQANINACKAKVDALQEVIDSVYSDKVGDIEDQAKA